MRRLVVRCNYIGSLLDIKPEAECFLAAVDDKLNVTRLRIISRTKRGRIIDVWCDIDKLDGFHYFWMERGHKLYLELRVFDLQKLEREKAAQAVGWLKQQRELALKNRNVARRLERVS